LQTVLHGTIDTDGNLQARANYLWTPSFVTKIQAQVSTAAYDHFDILTDHCAALFNILQLLSTPGHSVLQLEQDYQGADYSLNVKTVNPSPVDSTGIFILSYLQSVTQRVALGTEIVYQRMTPEIEETLKQFVVKYTGDDCIATLNYQELGAIQASYYQKINEKVEFGSELQVVLAGGRREAVCTIVS
jgi:mitochondrial import receptor subunit TOM40